MRSTTRRSSPTSRCRAWCRRPSTARSRLFGLRFTAREDLPVYHPDVKAYEVRNAAGAVVAIFLQDNFARATKRSGAWMSTLRLQSRNEPGGATAIPVVLNNNNFAKGAPGAPTLLSLEDARTLFHEFGHGLHGMLSDVTYERLSGTQVLKDFVELPSQLYEHWITEPEVLKQHARHWQTDEPIPDALIERMHAARRFNQGYETVRYCASTYADMAVHSLPRDQLPADISAWEAEEMQRRGLPDGVGMNHRLVHFQHLFSSSGYAAGYYVYLWAEVLDADGFEAFKEAGNAFDPTRGRTAAPLRLRQRQQPGAGRGLCGLPRARARRSSRCCASAGCWNRPEPQPGAPKIVSSELRKRRRSSGLVQ